MTKFKRRIFHTHEICRVKKYKKNYSFASILVEAYGDHALSDTGCKEWYARFGSSDTEDKERPNLPKKFEDT